MANNIVLFQSSDKEISLDVSTDGSTVWLTQAQMAELFSTTKQNVSLHVSNCFREGELEKEAVVKKSLTTAKDGKRYKTSFCNLDVIISVGYRVKSRRGVEFRRWATDVLRRYIIEGAATNERRLEQLGKVTRVMTRIQESPETRQVLTSFKATPPRSIFLTTTTINGLKRPRATRLPTRFHTRSAARSLTT